MNRSLLRAGVLAGATTLVLSLVATPAFALLPPDVSAQRDASLQLNLVAPAPTVTVTPAHVTLNRWDTTGLVAHLRGFEPSQSVVVALSSANAGGLIGEDEVDTEGSYDLHFGGAAGGATGTYTVNVFAPPADPSDPNSLPTLLAGTAFTVRSGSVIHWQPAHRSGTHLEVSAVVAKWSTKSKRYVRWAHAVVKFQEKVAGSWVTKKTVHTDAHGVATADITAGRHTWRALLVGTSHTWGGATGTHRK